eukprot:TRINITY_DN15826_c0_g1_i1.p2 TRINITY_DN15826_c0_g1~~TRINITY_DN15826_c0_g1_i1.p2  ORF type:complete len:117 (+),score=0.63 TRINITY_DN15826_c0_g1_i1:769-1119(+)
METESDGAVGLYTMIPIRSFQQLRNQPDRFCGSSPCPGELCYEAVVERPAGPSLCLCCLFYCSIGEVLLAGAFATPSWQPRCHPVCFKAYMITLHIILFIGVHTPGPFAGAARTLP